MNIKRFDVVQITTVKNVNFVSGPANRPAIPQGNWTVVAGVGSNELLLSKDETIIRIPVFDVVKIANYDVQRVIETIKEKTKLLGGTNGQSTKKT